MATAEPKRGTLKVYRVAYCKSCGHRIVQDHNTDFAWVHDETYRAACRP